MNSDHQYHLEKYNGRSTRHECPNCHDKRSFTYYVDETGAHLDTAVGRCDHESKCGYHYTPGQYFADHPQLTRSTSKAKRRRPRPTMPPPPPRPDFIPPDYVVRSCSKRSTLYEFLSTLISAGTLDRVWRDYYIGATKDKWTIFWQIDCENNTRTGKMMKFLPNGHRDKKTDDNPDKYVVDWIHAALKRRGAVSENFNLRQCLFGEHLLHRYTDKAVALVESEKTAVIGASIFPQYVWMATGSLDELKLEKIRPLTGRRVLAFPDVDGFDKWTDKAKELAKHGLVVKIMDVLERRATDEDRAAKVDIADLILRELAVHPEGDFILQRLVAQSPDMEQFVKDFDLEVV